MGRTLQTTHRLLIEEQQEFNDFRRALRREDKAVFDQLFIYMRLHVTAISQANHALPLEAGFLAIVLEQQKIIAKLQLQVNALLEENDDDKPQRLVLGQLP